MGPLHPTRKKVSGGHTDIPYMVAVPPLLRSELARLYPRRGPREAASCKTDRNLSSVTFTRRCNRTTPPPFSLPATVGLLWICRCDNRKCRVMRAPYRGECFPRGFTITTVISCSCTLLLDRVSPPKGDPGRLARLAASCCNSWAELQSKKMRSWPRSRVGLARFFRRFLIKRSVSITRQRFEKSLNNGAIKGMAGIEGCAECMHAVKKN